MNPKDLTPDEAEARIRAAIAEANLQDEPLDAFVVRLPTTRTSDLFGYLADHVALTTALGLVKDGVLVRGDYERNQIVSFAAVFAIKDEIDRRFPIPGGQR